MAVLHTYISNKHVYFTEEFETGFIDYQHLNITHLSQLCLHSSGTVLNWPNGSSQS